MAAREELRYRIADQVAEITLMRAPVNALSVPLLDEFVAALRRAGADDRIGAVVLSSALAGRFCAGIDLGRVLAGEDDVRELVQRLYVALADAQFQLGKPSIAAVGGAARGGGMTLAISCDVIIASESATFGYPEIDLGVTPAIHFAHLPTIVGRHRAFELLFSGRSFDADEAASLGLVSQVVPDERLHEEALALARSFAAKSRTAMRAGRAAFLRANDDGRGLTGAVDEFYRLARGNEAKEAMRAFVEKRARKQ